MPVEIDGDHFVCRDLETTIIGRRLVVGIQLDYFVRARLVYPMLQSAPVGRVDSGFISVEDNRMTRFRYEVVIWVFFGIIL